MSVNQSVENQPPQPPKKSVKKVEIRPEGKCRYIGKDHVRDEIHTIMEVEASGDLKIILTISEERTWRGPLSLFEKDFTSAV